MELDLAPVSTADPDLLGPPPVRPEDEELRRRLGEERNRLTETVVVSLPDRVHN